MLRLLFSRLPALFLALILTAILVLPAAAQENAEPMVNAPEATAPVISTETPVDTGSESTDTTSDTVEDTATETAEQAAAVASTLSDDLTQARDILLKNVGDKSFTRGFLIALLQPIFLASMFCLGLLAGQMSERLKHIWVLPVILYVATLAGAFITLYHPEWKPEFEGKYLTILQSTEAVCVAIGVIVGMTVGFALGIPVLLAMLGAIAIGLTLGFSRLVDIEPDHVLPFWAGFGLAGLLLNIFGIGFETFFQSINLKLVTRLIGVATAALALFLGAKLF